MIAFDSVAVTPLMGGMAGSGMAGGMMGGGTGGAMFVFPLVALFAVAALLVAGVLGAKLLASESDDGSDPSEPDEAPVERLKRRYAEGELTEAEFERALERELEREGTGGTDAGSRAETESTGEAARAG
ncbi:MULTISPECIES: SHOCT domain-containing protein [Halorubrum]|uniref:SHOCT domain-containing protein n=1 Tax=Halorubrum ruber TaxID=2982524 RepID=A0A8T8LJM2_9EURY|nr:MULTISPECIES: SHOCT domain-containing protein [Halorubrum]QUO46701.1 SHOCT domain-containing protein [Halorubrum ruber]